MRRDTVSAQFIRRSLEHFGKRACRVSKVVALALSREHLVFAARES